MPNTSETGTTTHQIRVPGTDKVLDFKSKRFPVSQETVFLIDFIRKCKRNFSRITELGSGSGYISLALGKLFPGSRIFGFEIQPHLVDLARENKELNGNPGNVSFICGDFRKQDHLPPQHSQNLVVCNPPFRKMNTGKVSPHAEVSIACHEISATLHDFVYAGSLILKHHGFFAMVILPERVPELVDIFHNRKIGISKIEFIHNTIRDSANAALILGRKEGKPSLEVLPPRIVHY